MLLAEDLLLLITDDASGRLSMPGAQADAGLGGANLVELTLLGKVDVAGEQDPGKPGRIIVRDPSPPGDEVLDAALQTLSARQGSKPSAVVRPLGKNLRPVGCCAPSTGGPWASSPPGPGRPRIPATKPRCASS